MFPSAIPVHWLQKVLQKRGVIDLSFETRSFHQKLYTKCSIQLMYYDVAL